MSGTKKKPAAGATDSEDEAYFTDDDGEKDNGADEEDDELEEPQIFRNDGEGGSGDQAGSTGDESQSPGGCVSAWCAYIAESRGYDVFKQGLKGAIGAALTFAGRRTVEDLFFQSFETAGMEADHARSLAQVLASLVLGLTHGMAWKFAQWVVNSLLGLETFKHNPKAGLTSRQSDFVTDDLSTAVLFTMANGVRAATMGDLSDDRWDDAAARLLFGTAAGFVQEAVANVLKRISNLYDPHKRTVPDHVKGWLGQNPPASPDLLTSEEWRKSVASNRRDIFASGAASAGGMATILGKSVGSVIATTVQRIIDSSDMKPSSYTVAQLEERVVWYVIWYGSQRGIEWLAESINKSTQPDDPQNFTHILEMQALCNEGGLELTSGEFIEKLKTVLEGRERGELLVSDVENPPDEFDQIIEDYIDKVIDTDQKRQSEWARKFLLTLGKMPAPAPQPDEGSSGSSQPSHETRPEPPQKAATIMLLAPRTGIDRATG